MTFTLMPLPFAKDALTPHMSAQTLEFHHEKHHKTYVDTLNKLIVGTTFANASLEEIIKTTADNNENTKIFNNAAQVWNHNFFWHCLSPKGGKPSGNIARQIDKAFGNLDDFKTKFKEAATSQFGSGWAWLVLDENGTLKITKTGNAVNPLVERQKTLLTCDVWEHAYYLDYQNRRADMVDVFLDKLINWEFVEQNLDSSVVSKAA